MFRPASLFLAVPFCCFAFVAAPGQPSSPTPSPTPAATPNATALIETMGPTDLQQVVQLLKNNYIDPAALNETALNRAMVSGVLMRLGHGVMLLPGPGEYFSETTEPFYGEVFEDHIGYLRLGALAPANLRMLDAALQKYEGMKVDAVVIDLRASGASNDFATAAEFAKRFCAKGETLFLLRKAAGKQERAFISDRDPSFKGLVIVLSDEDTAGPAEAVAGTLRLHRKALLIGATTAGRAVEYSDLPLNSGKILRVAVSEALLPEGRPLFPGGLKPDLPVEMAAAEKRKIFQESLQSGMSKFVFEVERAHLNEAALIAGRNPEIDALEASQRRKNDEKAPPRDVVLQRAIDLVTSLAIYGKR